MVPISLRLRNFLSYRDNVPPLSFEGMHLACLSGDNGHGKSALLDAITWALWGEARAKSNDDLVYAGATDMEVEFEFWLEGSRYRVLRKQSRARSPKESGRSSLELHVAQGDGFQPITGDNQRETQARINNLLHMEYQTFINSAFLLQGRADEFTKKGPAERKKVLADILGLAYYEGLEAKAREEARSREVRGEELRRVLADMEEELAQRPQLEDFLEKSRLETESLEGQVRAQDAALAVLRQEKNALASKKDQLAEARKDLAQAEVQWRQMEKQATGHDAQIQSYDQALAEAETVEQGFALLVTARQRNEDLNRKLTLMLGLHEKKGKLEASIQDAQNALTTQAKVAQSALAELESRANALPTLEADITRTSLRLEELGARDGEIREQRRRVLELAGQTQALRSENQKLHAEMQELRDRMDLLDQGQNTCPVCETELGEAGLRAIRERYLREGQAKKDEYVARQKLALDLANQQARLEKEADSDEASLRKERESVQRQAAAAQRDRAEAQQAAGRAAQLRQELEAVQGRLAGREFAQSERKDLETLVLEIGSLAYRKEEHQEVRRRVEELAPFEERKKRLDEAALRLPQEQEARKRAAEASQLWQTRIQETGVKIESLELELARYPRLSEEIDRAQTLLDALSSRLGVARQELGACRQRLEHCRQLEAQKQTRVAELARIEHERGIYQELAGAFGKKGIQAMIIEAAIPDLEAETNALLSRMTEGRMQVKLETQRDNKKGQAMETLDIRVSDELGTRNYELFSGGETFRINFCLRVALSKLLARRAGAQLRLLVIDEGFGTQDAQGKERLVEAINAIQDDFDKILVITHIQELKELFPVRIEVVKTAEGSMYYVN
ncbi:MAG: SMC family ATPase [Dehalococcoidia bacterium]|nr:SMC family ATPase [Dehalococcoidia bacterium]